MKIRHTICYLRTIIIIGAYCVGRVQNMLPCKYYDNRVVI